MAQFGFGDARNVAGSAAAAVLCTLLTQRLFNRQTELLSEGLAWLMLPFLIRASNGAKNDEIPKPSTHEKASASTLGTWLFAGGIAIAAFCTAENGVAGLYPALGPLLLLVQKNLQSDPLPSDSSLFATVSFIVNSIWGSALVALLGIIDLSIWDLKSTFLSVITVTGLLSAYVTVLPRSMKKSSPVPQIYLERNIEGVSSAVVACIGAMFLVQSLILGLTISSLLTIAMLAIFKCFAWYFTIQTTRHSTWSIVPSMGVFSLMATQIPHVQSLSMRPFMHLILALLSLGQVVCNIPPAAKGRFLLLTFFLIALVPYLANISSIHHAENMVMRTFGGKREHPVEVLIRMAKSNYEALLHRQSKTYEAAHKEYRRRYGIEPPPGFEAWYEFAITNQSPIIDEFDMIHELVSPFLKVSGQDILNAMDAAHAAPLSELWLCKFYGVQASTQCAHKSRTYDRHITTLFNKLSQNLGGAVPDVKFLVNHLDEPAVVIPQPILEGNMQDTSLIKVTDYSHRRTWEAITASCALKRGKGTVFKDERESYSLPFIKDASTAMDLCRHPEYSDLHGLFMGPTSLRLIQGLVPVLSTGAPSTMSDIIFPSPAYIESEFKYDGTHDIAWEEKRNNVYWAGSTSGGYAMDDQWRNYHRQRFVNFVQNLDRQQYYYLEEKEGVVERVSSSFLNGRLFDVAFTRIFQCNTRKCRDQRAFFRAGAWADKDAALRSRLVFDLDGNGISGRYYKLLASKSLPLKQTLIREWHDERLVPWVHYVPVSQSMEELPEIVLYLTSTDGGRRRAKEMATQGREWFSKAFREVDMTIYVYRLLLELARLQDPQRQATS